MLQQFGLTRGRTLHQLELPSKAAAHADVSHVASFHDIVQSPHCLLDRSVLIEPMALQNVDVVELQSLERLLDRGKDMLWRQSVRSLHE
jgi:hypothetical protein